MMLKYYIPALSTLNYFHHGLYWENSRGVQISLGCILYDNSILSTSTRFNFNIELAIQLLIGQQYVMRIERQQHSSKSRCGLAL